MWALLAAVLLAPTVTVELTQTVDGAGTQVGASSAIARSLKAAGADVVGVGGDYRLEAHLEAARWAGYPHSDVAHFYNAHAVIRLWRGRELIISADGVGRGQHFAKGTAANTALRAALDESLGTVLEEVRALPAELLSKVPDVPLLRGVAMGPEAAATPTTIGPLFRKTHAVVIGIDRAPKLPDLNAAQADAVRMANRLRADGAQVTLLLGKDATRRQVAATLGDELPAALGADDRVIVYFAGHGVSVGKDADAMGYLMPVDADPQQARSTGLSMRELQAWFRRYKARHVLFIADACYSGLAVMATRDAPARRLAAVPKWLRDQANRRVRATLVAGGAGELAVEDQGRGLFTQVLLEGLDGAADANADEVVTGLELAVYTRTQVSKRAALKFGREQTPQFAQEGEGEFLFVLKALRRRAVLSP